MNDQRLLMLGMVEGG